jgi:hypothetical protein
MWNIRENKKMSVFLSHVECHPLVIHKDRFLRYSSNKEAIVGQACKAGKSLQIPVCLNIAGESGHDLHMICKALLLYMTLGGKYVLSYKVGIYFS